MTGRYGRIWNSNTSFCSEVSELKVAGQDWNRLLHLFIYLHA